MSWQPPIISPEGLDEVARILDQAPLIVHDFGGRITHWTVGSATLYGWRRDEAIGRVVNDLLETEYSEPLDGIKQVLLTGGTWKGEIVHKHRRGAAIPVSSQMTCLAVG